MSCSKECGLILYKLSTLCTTVPTRAPARPHAQLIIPSAKYESEVTSVKVKSN